MQNTLVSDLKLYKQKVNNKRLAEKSAGCIRQKFLHEEKSAP